MQYIAHKTSHDHDQQHLTSLVMAVEQHCVIQ